MSERRRLQKLLRESTPLLVLRTIRGEVDWSGALFRPERTVEITGYGALVDEYHRSVATADAWSGVTLLASWAPTPFTLDSLRYSSVESFYHSLKYAEGSEERGRVATLPGPEAQHAASHRRGKTFQFRGAEYDVGSPEHVSFIAEAVVAKIDQHANVRAALLATEDAELTFPDGIAHRNVLGAGATLALMIERLRLSTWA